ncbi:hypothetical protein FI667_g12404, partial [Globisporangium splendens]
MKPILNPPFHERDSDEARSITLQIVALALYRHRAVIHGSFCVDLIVDALCTRVGDVRDYLFDAVHQHQALVAPENALAVRDAIMSSRNALVLGVHRGSSIPTTSDPGIVPRPSSTHSASEDRDIDLVDVSSDLAESVVVLKR